KVRTHLCACAAISTYHHGIFCSPVRHRHHLYFALVPIERTTFFGFQSLTQLFHHQWMEFSSFAPNTYDLTRTKNSIQSAGREKTVVEIVCHGGVVRISVVQCTQCTC